MDAARRSRAWQYTVVALCAVFALESAVNDVWRQLAAVDGATGVGTVPTAVPFVYRVASVDPGSSAHVGDTIDLRRFSPSDRWKWFHGGLTRGERVTLTVERNGQLIPITVVARERRYFGASYRSIGALPYWAAVAGSFWMLLFAALIAWRRPESREARVLSLLLFLFGITGTLANSRWGPPAFTAVLYAIGIVANATSGALFATYAMLFQPASRLRSTLTWITYVLWALNALDGLSVLLFWTLAIDPDGSLFKGPLAISLSWVLPFFVPILCALLAIRETADGAARARLSWVTASLGISWAFGGIGALIGVFAPSAQAANYFFVNFGAFVLPLGLTYAMLNRKLLDVRFALNRAAVFTAISAIVVGAFVLVEWAFGEWLRDASRTTNVIVSAGLALALGLSVRFVHGRVEHFVDRVFFRKRHDDETALRNFAHEAGYITDASTLVERAQSTIAQHADASSVALVLDNGHGRYGDASENDPAIVALRAWHKPLDLHGLDSVLEGELAYPMVSRGRLVGALVVGPKRSGETYAPDESDALRHVAHGVGMALDVLTLKTPSANGQAFEVEVLAEAIASALKKSLPAQ